MDSPEEPNIQTKKDNVGFLSLSSPEPILKRFKKIGSWALVASMALGVGNFNVATTTAAYYGTDYLWVFWAGAICYFFLLEATTRIYLYSGLTPARLFKKINKGLSVFLFFYVVFAAIATISFELAIFGLIGTVFGVNYYVMAFAVGSSCVLLLILGVYSKLEKIFNALMIFLIATIISTAISIGWPVRPEGIWISNITPTMVREAIPMMMSIVSTIVSALFFLGYPYFMKEKDWTPERFSKYKEKAKVLGWARLDILIGAIMGPFLAIPMTAIVAKIVYPLDIPIRSATDLMMVMEPLLGRWSSLVWGAGLLVAGFTSSVGLLLLASYITLDTFELNPKLGTNSSKILIVAIFLGSTPLVLLNINVVFLTLFVSALRSIFYPLTAIVILYAINKTEYSGYLQNKKIGVGNLIGGFAVLVLFLLAVNGVFELVNVQF
ncbi:hypothetical protein K9M78_03740 [Candidatus Bipolaricaulota bacterium]|nr:hypothetical protein [Candidatus Bipolaricaulota bacterium]